MDDEAKPYLLTEASGLTGLSVDALRKRIRRGKPETVKGNDGLVRVRLTTADMEALRLAEGQPRPSPPDESGRTIAALEAERDAARLAAAKAEGESGTLREQVGAERARADRAEAAGAEARALADRRLLEVAELRERAGRAEGEAEALRRPWWRRWLG